MREMLSGLLSALAYGGVGIALLALGYLLVDLVTPGNLRRQIWEQRNRNAALVLVSGLAAVAIIVTTAILTSEDGLLLGLLSTALYGVLGILVMAVAFVLLDLATPGRLGALLVDEAPHPAVWVTAAVNLAVGAITAAAIS
ncbi:DUF350 domain-containing protein [Actinocatenispora comari]|uniref:DUF350 domain-containing protein n=2 Tax=Actinocatenispora comari TaxID=2807577 RepID=A0A8J4AIT1_9ACTN|nr:DUF350 domain-containing protein [Actinocatenispora comari]GIL31994.1 DUF350 domain-containing protein [Actinocatenispora comari]